MADKIKLRLDKQFSRATIEACTNAIKRAEKRIGEILHPSKDLTRKSRNLAKACERDIAVYKAIRKDLEEQLKK